LQRIAKQRKCLLDMQAPPSRRALRRKIAIKRFRAGGYRLA